MKIVANEVIDGARGKGRWTNRKGIAHHFAILERSVSNLTSRRVLPFVKVGRIVRFDVLACESAFRAFETRSVVQFSTLDSRMDH